MSAVRHHSVQVPATSANLGPGFDAFGLAVDRYLAVRSVPRSVQAERVQTVPAAADLPTGDDNLIWRSLVAFCDDRGVSVPDVALRTTTAIPVERGLGSSSAAIVAGVVLARALTGEAVGDRELVTLLDRLEGHPDNVAPALLGGLVACTTDAAGGLVVRRRNPTPALRPVVLVPELRQGTEAARGLLPTQLDRADVVTQAARAGHVLAGLAGAWPVDAGAAGDVLHEPARQAAMPASARVLDELRAAGVHAWLSGAGPSVAAAVPALAAPQGLGGPAGAAPLATAGEVAAAPTPGGGAASLPVLDVIAGRHGFHVLRLRFDLAGALACPDDGCALTGTGGCVQCPRQRL